MKQLMRRILLVAVLMIWSGTSAHAFYDASLGRWMNRDPIGEKFDRNLYRHALNDPVLRVDSYGLQVVGVPIQFPVPPPSTPVNIPPPCAPYPDCLKPDPAESDCIKRCIAANGGNTALGIFIGASGTVGTLPKLTKPGALGAGGVTTGFSYIQMYVGIPVRQLGRRLNPAGTVVQCATGPYFIGNLISCSTICAGDPNAY